MQPKRRKALFIGLTFFLIMLVVTIGVATNIDRIRQEFTKATGEKANLVVDALAIEGELQRPWRHLAQGGEDHNWQLTPIINQVKALHPDQIRLDHLYDFYDVPTRASDGSLKYDWTKLDALVDQIASTGAKPFFSLSYIPPALAKDGDIVGTPTSWDELEQVYERTIDHYSREKGIENVYYEVWNEPDWFGKWKIGGSKDYLRLYGAAARAAARISSKPGAKPFKLGGPASTALYENWFKGLLKYCESNNYQLDFLSWHRYSTSIDVFRKDIGQATRWLYDFPKYQNVEFMITEWGHDSELNAGYDGNFGAIHTLAVATELEGFIQRAFVFEIQDGKDPAGNEYWGRWGLFTHNDFGAKPKPRYKALKMLEELGNLRLQLVGKGTWVKALATQSGESLKILVVNYDPAKSNTESVPLTIKNLTESSYRVTIVGLDGSPRIQELKPTDLTLSLTLPMGPNQANMVTITPSSIPEPSK